MGVEPAVEDWVGESRGHGDRVAEAEAQVEAALVGLRWIRGQSYKLKWFSSNNRLNPNPDSFLASFLLSICLITYESCLKEEEDVGEDDEEVEGEPGDGEDEADQRQDERHAPVPLQLALAPPLVRLKARVLPAIRGALIKGTARQIGVGLALRASPLIIL